MGKAPAITVGVIGSLVAATLALLAAFGLALSPEQQTAILNFIAIAAPVVTGLITYVINSRRERAASLRRKGL